MQAQARSTSADVRTSKRLYSDLLSSYPDVFVPPGMACHFNSTLLNAQNNEIYMENTSHKLSNITIKCAPARCSSRMQVTKLCGDLEFG